MSATIDGDIVVCVDDGRAGGQLKVGERYVVEKAYAHGGLTHVELVGVPGMWSEERFTRGRMPKLALGGDMKDTNPKDAIGVLKPKVSVIPANVIFDVGLALLEGACKYGRHNYRGVGVRASVYYDATMGHLMDWWEGEDTDPDSGLSHVTKALASLVVLRDAMMQGKVTDDRPPASKMHKRDFADKAKAIIEQHADKSPHHYTILDGKEAAT